MRYQEMRTRINQLIESIPQSRIEITWRFFDISARTISRSPLESAWMGHQSEEFSSGKTWLSKNKSKRTFLSQIMRQIPQLRDFNNTLTSNCRGVCLPENQKWQLSSHPTVRNEWLFLCKFLREISYDITGFARFSAKLFHSFVVAVDRREKGQKKD